MSQFRDEDEGMHGYRVRMESATPYAAPPASYFPLFVAIPSLWFAGLLALLIGIGAMTSDLAGPDEREAWRLAGIVIALVGVVLTATAAYLTVRSVRRRTTRPAQPAS